MVLIIGEGLANDAELLTAARQGPTVSHGAKRNGSLVGLSKFAQHGLQFPTGEVNEVGQAFRFDMQIAADHVVGDTGIAEAQHQRMRFGQRPQRRFVLVAGQRSDRVDDAGVGDGRVTGYTGQHHGKAPLSPACV